MTTLPLRIALRYLFSRKSYHVINMISGIGAAGMAIGTAALVVILSVFNGFDSLVSQSLTDAHPDLMIKPAAGKVFRPDSLSWLVEEPSIVRLSSVLEDQAFLSCDGKQGLVLVKGVDLAAEEESPLKAHMIDGVWQLHRGDRAMAVAGAGLAAQLGLNPRFLAPLELHYPSRTEAISLANPAASLRSVKLGLAGVLSVSSELDAKLLVAPIGSVRELLGYETEVSALEIWTAPEQAQALQKALQERLGTHFRVLDRYQQNASVYKMMRYEKLAIFLILIFVVLIIAFNIYSSLRMLVIEKEADIATLRSMGATDSLVRRIFRLEGWLVSLVGIVIGLVLGVALVLLQQQLGLVPMPGNFIVDAYPVVLRASDLLWTVAGVALIGYLMALLPTRRL